VGDDRAYKDRSPQPAAVSRNDFTTAEVELDAILDEDEAAQQDIALVEAIGIDVFYRQQIVKLVGFVIMMGAKLHDAEDIAQVAMLKLLEDWNTVRDPIKWVHTVATNTYKRGSRAREAATGELILESAVAPALFSPESRAEVAEEFAEVAAALSELPEQQRLAIAWRMYDYTNAETAEALGTTRKAVAAAYRRGRQTLKARLCRGEGQ
jgi:RNA polymerase sigma factor (sigma-70 family)